MTTIKWIFFSAVRRWFDSIVKYQQNCYTNLHEWILDFYTIKSVCSNRNWRMRRSNIAVTIVQHDAEWKTRQFVYASDIDKRLVATIADFHEFVTLLARLIFSENSTRREQTTTHNATIYKSHDFDWFNVYASFWIRWIVLWALCHVRKQSFTRLKWSQLFCWS